MIPAAVILVLPLPRTQLAARNPTLRYVAVRDQAVERPANRRFGKGGVPTDGHQAWVAGIRYRQRIALCLRIRLGLRRHRLPKNLDNDMIKHRPSVVFLGWLAVPDVLLMEVRQQVNGLVGAVQVDVWRLHWFTRGRLRRSLRHKN